MGNNLFNFDKKFDAILVGTDEAGRGPGAGGVFAAAVCFKPECLKSAQAKLARLNDSKKLSKKIREEFFEIIKENSYYSIQCIEVEEIEKINILNSSLKAMRLACEDVIEQCYRAGVPDLQINNPVTNHKSRVTTLVDGNRKIKDFAYSQQTVVKGDSKSASIAAASVLAKVSRDFYMQELAKKYPQYDWHKNAGYLTKSHIQAIKEFGPTLHHRRKFLRKIEKEISDEA